MAKYIFLEEWSKIIKANTTDINSIGGISEDINIQYRVGDVVEGQEYPEGQYLVVMPRPNVFINIPYSVLQKYSGSINPKIFPPSSGTFFTTKNIIIGILAIVVIIGILKWLKVF